MQGPGPQQSQIQIHADDIQKNLVVKASPENGDRHQWLCNFVWYASLVFKVKLKSEATMSPNIGRKMRQQKYRDTTKIKSDLVDSNHTNADVVFNITNKTMIDIEIII